MASKNSSTLEILIGSDLWRKLHPETVGGVYEDAKRTII